MADSDFWKNLAEQFRALDPSGMLRADWDYIVNSGNVDQWQIKGADRSIRVRFEALARRAGSAIAEALQKDPLFIWLADVKATGPHFEFGPYVIEKHVDGTDGPQHQLGTLNNLCIASAERCSEYESYALESEFREKQKNDPRNWSPLRSQYEAFKGIGQLVSAPHERIPESFVRDVLAKQYGVRPDEVTWKQIAFEVSGLLCQYPAIQVVPTPPAQEVDRFLHKEDPSEPQRAEPIAAQINRLRRECNWTEEQLAEKVGVTTRTVQRHLAEDSTPYARHIATYERVFSKQLEREVVIRKMS
jgi:DNA-binding XRE family transcriptional regulator